MKKRKPIKTALLAGAAVAAVVVLLACANYLAGALLFLSFGEHPGKAQFTSIEQAYSASPDARTMKKIRGSSIIALLLCIGGPVGLGLMLHKKKSDLFGNARFASKDDIKEEKLDASKGVVIGKFKNELLRLGGYEFVLLAAPTRTGKGVGFCVPNLLQFEDSAVVLDIKGENYNLTSEFRRRYMGNEIIYFNPFSENTHRWNPLSYVAKDPNFRASDLMALASIIYPVNDKDPFWSDAAKNLFVGLGLLVLETPELPQTIGEILRQGSGKGHPIEKYLTHVLAVRAASERPLSAACRDSLSRFLGSGEQALKGIVATFSATLTPFGNAVIDKATSDNDFDLRDVRKKKMTIYLNIPAGEILQASFIVNLFFSQLINENVKELPEQNPALKYQCLLMLDEFTAMGKVAIIAKGVGYMAGYNMRLAIIIQDKTQLDAVYGKEDAHNIVSNMGAVIYFTPSQISEAEEYSKMIGNDTVTSKSQQHSKSSMFSLKGGGGDSETDSYQSRALMLPQELLSMSKDSQLVVRSGIPVIKADKIRYFEDDYFKERFNAVPMHDVTIGSERRKVPVPVKLPKGNWDSYAESVKGSEYYVDQVVLPSPEAGAGAGAGAPAAAAPDVSLQKADSRAGSPAAAPAPLQQAYAAPAAVPEAPAQPVAMQAMQVPAVPEAAPQFDAGYGTAQLAGPAQAASTYSLPALPTGYVPFASFYERLAAPADLALPAARAAVAYAECIARYWEAAQLAELTDPGTPLTILDLTPGDGSFAWQLIAALQERQDASGAELPHFQYLACAATPDEQAKLQAHPYFDAITQQEQFFVVLREEMLANEGAVFSSNPLVALAHGLMGRGRQDNPLLAARNGEVLGIEVKAAGAVQHQALPIAMRFVPAAPGELAPAAAALMAGYGESAGGIPVSLPLGAMACVDTVDRISAGMYLLLCSDPAVIDQREIRSGVFAPPDQLALPAPPLPVNYHALAQYLDSLGDAVWQEKSPDSELCMCLALSSAARASMDQLFPTLQPVLAGAHSDDSARYERQVYPDMGIADGLDMLQRARHDPRCLQALLPLLLERNWDVGAVIAEQWQQALAQTWTMYLPRPDDSGFLLQTAGLALKAGHYGLASEAASRVLFWQAGLPDALAVLAEAEALRGRTDAALAAARELLLQRPDSAAIVLNDELEHRLRLQQSCAWYRPEAAQNGPLWLEPLAGHHAGRMLAQLRGSQSGTLAGLPDMQTVEQVDAWLAGQELESGRMSCAVMHDSLGFVGVVSARKAGAAADFHFWIGSAYQRRGFGVAGATALLLMVRDYNEVAEFFAVSGAANRRAHSALGAIGFRQLDDGNAQEQAAPHHFYIGDEQDDARAATRLRDWHEALSKPLETV
jgi:type IV secretion system protein VirD4